MRKRKDACSVPAYSKKYPHQKSRSKSNHSILQKHELRLKEYESKKEKLHTLSNKISSLESSLRKENTKDLSELKNKLHDLHQEKLLLEQHKDEEINYLLNSSNIMNDFLELEERENHLLSQNKLSDILNSELNDITSRKNDLVDEYLSIFEPDYYNHTKNYKIEIPYCDDCNVPYDTENSFMVCPLCGICKATIEQANEMSYKERQDYDYRPQFTYDKRTHLEDWLRRFQSKENRSIPQEILDKVILEAKKERIQDLNVLTEDKVKKYLKKLNLNDYYDNIIGIINRINGRPPFRLTSEIEDKIKTMFQQIQDPYEKFKPPNRKNFLSYSYTLCKFFQILGLHEFAKYFPLLKSTDKLRQQDDIFKKIVAHMAQVDPATKWVFYPSI
jgi:hypothetical protein